jgi:NAD(P)-dependent dehydrogenase (short-subunit alcohol dehydrogenase family)
MSRLDGRVALVTGGARGLGAGIARRFAQEGATVVIGDVMDGSGTAAELDGDSRGRHEYARLDVSDTADVERVVAGVAERHGSLDIVANNAGVAHPTAPVHETPDDQIDRVLAINVRGLIAVSRAAVRIMREQERGRIINTASQTGKLAWPDWGVYSASKAAVIAITQVMAVEVAPWNITVNAICPGTMVTDMMRTGFSQSAERTGGDVEEMIAEHARSIPLGRMGTAEDMGAMAAWLASDDASFTTGAALNLTGGEQVFF